MPLYVRDDAVDDLAKEYMRLSGAKTKSDAVKAALTAQIEAMKAQKPVMELIEELQVSLNAQLGEPDPNFDMKTWSDDEEEL